MIIYETRDCYIKHKSHQREYKKGEHEMTHMNKPTDTIDLANGVRMPCIGFGTWQAADGREAKEACLNALKAGYRHIDTAAVYLNEDSVGDAIKESGIPREELFITTKLWNGAHEYEKVMPAFEESLSKLGLDYVDLYLIHWPNPLLYRDTFETSIKETWKGMEEIYATGKAKAIGISNFLPHHIEVIKSMATVMPMVNQIRIHPGYVNVENIDYCLHHNIILEAYSPFGTGRFFEHPMLLEMAKKYNTTVAKLCVRWSLQMGFCPLPKSVHQNRIQENLDVFGFEILGEDVEKLAKMENPGEVYTDPDKVDF